MLVVGMRRRVHCARRGLELEQPLPCAGGAAILRQRLRRCGSVSVSSAANDDVNAAAFAPKALRRASPKLVEDGTTSGGRLIVVARSAAAIARIILSARAAYRSAHRRRGVSGSDLRRPAAHAKKRRGAAHRDVRGDDRRRRPDHGNCCVASRDANGGHQRPQRGGGARPARRPGRVVNVKRPPSARSHRVAVHEARPQLRHLQRRQRSAGAAAAGRDRAPARDMSTSRFPRATAALGAHRGRLRAAA